MFRPLRRAAAGLLLASAIVAPLRAADIQVNPVRITLSPEAPIAAMVVRNAGAEPVQMQVRIVDWSQEDGKDILRPTNDVLANPPLFRLRPKDEQIVRFGLQVGSAPTERSYRILIDEVPARVQLESGQVRTVLQISVPIFVPTAGAEPQLVWSVAPDRRGNAVVKATNNGNSHIQILSLSLTGSKGGVVADKRLSAYLLPKQSHQWALPAKGALAAGQGLQLTAQTDWREVKRQLTVGPTANAADSP